MVQKLNGMKKSSLTFPEETFTLACKTLVFTCKIFVMEKYEMWGKNIFQIYISKYILFLWENTKFLRENNSFVRKCKCFARECVFLGMWNFCERTQKYCNTTFLPISYFFHHYVPLGDTLIFIVQTILLFFFNVYIAILANCSDTQECTAGGQKLYVSGTWFFWILRIVLMNFQDRQ